MHKFSHPAANLSELRANRLDELTMNLGLEGGGLKLITLGYELVLNLVSSPKFSEA